MKDMDTIYNKGFKNIGIKESAWKIMAEKVNTSVKDCTARWQTLRERFAKEKRILEQERRQQPQRPEWPMYNFMSFLTPHIRKRKSLDNFPRTSMVSVPTPSPTLSSTDEEMSLLSSLIKSSDNIEILEDQIVDDVSAPFTCSVLPLLSPGSSTVASVLYLGPTGRCKKSKMDETAEMFKETLANLNKSMAAPPISPLPSIDINDPDALISTNVEICQESYKYGTEIEVQEEI
ncbi:uncharacterized protein LOC116851979 [Odontomachus brunneus]|uniref:uncharacterized protein LOC116851979 n=1 Tax=Odontomachus brunneus TaxID=486640 RepID=UPI0013F1E74B|nr:uncharacterized protein LOC116851979 [Odontomachus brunneus]XP_032687801.1 uncharacterized protein LOC116851979 [Odontomachus brunneus]